MKLTIELVPAIAWGSNLRRHLGASKWRKLSNRVRDAAGNKCQICGYSHSDRRFDCHEIWHYDDTRRVQKLVGLQCLCTRCHMVKHFGLATMQGKLGIVMEHLMKINEMSRGRAMNYIDIVNATWKQRNKVDWTLDLGEYEQEGS